MPKKSKKPTILPTPTKSPADPLLYRALELHNGLKVLLISDPTADMGFSDDEENDDVPTDEEEDFDDSEDEGESDDENADDDIGLRNAAAALCVGSGGFHEPPDAPGLAHFLEHMVFMGSKKFPDENKFDSFISARNGWSNAYTDAEVTLYYFEVKPSSFEESLDIWSRFYIDPLLKPDSVNREVQAVDSEFKIAQTRDDNRVSGILTNLAPENHPAGKFTWGNILSLKGTNDTEAEAPHLYENLVALHKKYYAAKTMALAIQSPHDLDELQKMVVKRFGAIPNPKEHVTPHLEIKDYEKDADIWKAQYGKLIEMVPVGEKVQMKIMWQLAPLMSEWKSDPVHYISWLVGHEGKGSIFDYLQSEGLATEVSGGVDGYGDTVNRLYTKFGIEITLTELGGQNISRVLNTIHSYLAMMRADGAKKSIYDMVAKIDLINWKTKDLEEPNENVVDCAENMLKYPSEHWLDAEDVPFEYNPELIQRVLDTMTQERAIVFFLDPKFQKEDESNFPLEDKWFGVRWRQADAFDYKFERLPGDALYYPNDNPYLTDDLDTKTVQEEKSEVPILLKSTEQANLYFMPDFEFKLPKSYIKALYRCENFLHEEEHLRVALLYLVPTFMSLDLSSELYDATTASLSHSIDMKSSGFMLETRGISSTCPKLLLRMVKWVSEPELWNEANFNLAKEQVQTSFQNKLLESSTVGRDTRVRFLETGATNIPEVVEQFQSPELTFANMKKALRDLLEASTLDLLIQGNTNKELSEKFFDDIIALQPIGGSLKAENEGIKVRHLAKNESLHVRSFNTRTSDNHYVTKYYQFEGCSARDQVLAEVFTDIISEPTFNELRTKRQLGYVAFSSLKNSWGVTGWSVDVKSAVENHKVEYIQKCIDEYTDDFIPNEILKKLTEKEFKTYVASMIVSKSAKDNQLKDLAKRNWGEIESNNLFFNRLEKEIDWLEELSMDEFMKFVQEDFLPKCRVLQVQVHGNEEGAQSIPLTEYSFLESSTIDSLPPSKCAFKKYPVIKNL